MATATVLLDTVEAALLQQGNGWIFLRELRTGTGMRHHELQRLDAFAFNCLPHTGMKRICYEAKLSRADFLNELRRPLKRRIGLRFSNEFYFVAPTGLLEPSEIPVDCGLLEVGTAVGEQAQTTIRRDEGFLFLDAATSLYCRVAVPAPWRDTPAPTWQFTAAMLRNAIRTVEAKPVIYPKQQKLELT